jgi:hypothetical protein
MNQYKIRDYERGQMLLIVVLIMVTVLTITLSLATRTVTHLRITQDEENSERAFSAAEAGIEQSLTNQLQTSGSFSNGTSYKTSVLRLAGVEFLLNNGAPILKDSPADLLLTDYPNYANSWSGTISFFWGDVSDFCSSNEFDNTAAALEIVVISGTKLNPISTQYTVDPCSSRASANNFEYVTPSGGTLGGKTFKYKKTIAVSSGMLVRVIPLYASTSLGVNGCDAINANCRSLPDQGSIIESVGVSDTTQRKVVSFSGYPTLPTEVFPFVLFSPR